MLLIFKTKNENYFKEKKKQLIKEKVLWKVLNKKEIRDVEILKTWEAGIILLGNEVKSILKGNFDFKNSFVFIDRNQEVFLTNFKITISQKQTQRERNYKLLLNRSEIKLLQRKKEEKKLIIIPTQIYLKKNKIKMEIALGKRKRKYEKERK